MEAVWDGYFRRGLGLEGPLPQPCPLLFSSAPAAGAAFVTAAQVTGGSDSDADVETTATEVTEGPGPSL